MPEVLGLHHIAFAHTSDESPYRRLAETFGLDVAHQEQADGFTERMTPVGAVYLQTLEVQGSGTLDRFIRKRGSSLHHVALEVDDLEAWLDRLRAMGIELIDDRPRPGGMGTRIAFLHPRAFDGLLVELVERSARGDEGGAG
jgi:methylmalonyl-CoA/ethylmalonyl-CoA epimerase